MASRVWARPGGDPRGRLAGAVLGERGRLRGELASTVLDRDELRLEPPEPALGGVGRKPADELGWNFSSADPAELLARLATHEPALGLAA